MRDGVLDKKFTLKKELSFALEKRFPNYFIPRYSMVMFHNEIPYSVSQERGATQKEILDELTKNTVNLNQIDFIYAEKIIKQQLTPL
jgi:kynurenine 3-monooxygenase